MKKLWTSLLLLCFGMFAPCFGADLKESHWEALVPGNMSIKEMEKIMSKAAIISGEDSVSFDPQYFSAVKDLQGKRVKIAGYVIPLDPDAQHVDEFLLVPYTGSCVHSPPPPPNQTIYVKMKQKVSIKILYEVVMVEGVIDIKTKELDIGNALYSMTGHSAIAHTLAQPNIPAQQHQHNHKH